MNIAVRFTQPEIRGKVLLPASKSISNRVLIINALADSSLPVVNLSDCDDTRVMQNVLHSNESRFDIGHAGTAMRFLTAFLSRIVGKWEITGSERMKQRPVGVLVDALNRLGARIVYKEKAGYPPLVIYGSLLKGGELSIPASVSSQYISALMMIAPYMTEGLRLKLEGKVVSRTYIDMTIAIMRAFGAEVTSEENTVTIASGPYTPVTFSVESDWSGASYFYELLAVAGKGELILPGLLAGSVQGDARQVKVWEKLGVDTFFEEGQVRIVARPEERGEPLEFDFTEMPDLVQSFAVACCMKNKPFCFSGVETLRIKETDRIAALIREMGKLGFHLRAEGDERLVWKGESCERGELSVSTYHDHRMAMAFAPAAWKYPGLVICDRDVVTKSFPGYWIQLEKLGLSVREC